MAVVLSRTNGVTIPLPQLERAREFFHASLSSGDKANSALLRRAYLRLALQFHPDKRPEDDRQAATQLFQAIAAVYEEMLRAQDPEISQIPARVKSPVAAAAELGDCEELRRLLTLRPNTANEADDLGVYPLMFAAAGGCIRAAETLLDFGADLQACNPIKWSVLLYAALGNHADMVRFLVSRGAGVTDHELILAAYTGNPASLEALLHLYEGSVPLLRTDESKKTLLHLACEGLFFLKHAPERHAECVELVLKWNVPVDVPEPRRGRTCLHDFVSDVRWRTRRVQGSPAHVNILERLCALGASVTAEDFEGNCAISIAADMGFTWLREILLSYA